MNRTTTPLVCLFSGMLLVLNPVHATPLTTASPDATTDQPASPAPTGLASQGTHKSDPNLPVLPTTTTATPGAPQGLTDTHNSIWDQDLLTGDWGGLRTDLNNEGFKISPTYVGEVFGNPSGGAKQGIITDGLFNVALDFDLERMTSGAVEGLTIHANALYIYGSSLSSKYVGDFSNTSNIAGYNSIRLQELWLQKTFWEKRISLKVGNMAVDTEFFQSATGSLFLNGTFGAFTFLGSNVPDAPVYPVASPGVRVQFLPTSNFYVMAGVYGMDLNSNPAINDHYGVHFAMNGNSGLLVMSEAGYLLNQSPNDRGLQGTYRIGSFVQTANYDTWGSQAKSALGTGSLQSGGTDYGIYGVLDQQLFTKDDEAISLFVRSGGAPSNVNFVDYYVDGGFNFTGFIPGRTSDVMGIAVARSHVSSDFSDSQVLQGSNPYSAETVVETTYKAQLAPWWSVQPDFQYIFTPSGVTGSKNAVVLGVRTNIAF